MIFERFEAEGLAHYSYAVGCPGAGEIAIVDPERNIDRYVEFAERNGVRITHVLETHIHADFASGARALADRTGARVSVSAYDEGETFEVGFDHKDLRDGDETRIGPVRIVAVYTPGHTPEHLSFLVYDEVRTATVPQLMLTGDFLFVGALGRPDLLGEEAKRLLARRLFASVREKLAGLPDALEIYPAHGAGSLCGAGLSGKPMSTLGFERATNPYLNPELTEDAFVDMILSNVPPFPPYYKRMKALNSVGARPHASTAAAMQPAEFRDGIDTGHVVVDVRDRLEFSGGHIPAALAMVRGPSLVVWASWFVPYETPIQLIVRDAAEAEHVAQVFRRVGLDHVVGFLDGGMRAWQEAALPIAQTTWADPASVDEQLRADTIELIDVRSESEYAEGHAQGAEHGFLGELPG
ncbi:MAG: rhodanese-like domain-containing protein, partial [Planctomycetota bacterium]|nr:rhodanese-like domain-containing protein [Planctomycetota bacterium]